ncbi:MAG: hypothetical protein MJA84_12125 [Firmicutes bacterium]|nr:hypothetical protein [Bacillota bacterium]
MHLSGEHIISLAALISVLLLLIFAVDWRYFRDWVAVFLFLTTINLILGSIVVEKKLIEYPFRLSAPLFDTSLLFELWVLPALCILYNQVTRTYGLWPVFYHAVLFSAGITAVEYPLELYTDLINYINWSWHATLFSVMAVLLTSRSFIAFYRWGCRYFP